MQHTYMLLGWGGLSGDKVSKISENKIQMLKKLIPVVNKVAGFGYKFTLKALSFSLTFLMAE